jgi:hypothetical protein
LLVDRVGGGVGRVAGFALYCEEVDVSLSFQVNPKRQTREVLSVGQLAALRKIQRLDYLLSACSAPIVRRVMEVMDQVESPEARVEAAVVVLQGEIKLGRESDFVRACLASLNYCDEREL